MSLGELTKFIINGIVNDKDSVNVVETEQDEKTILINVHVNEDDLGRVIGKDGKMINAIRTLIQEASSLREGKFVKVEVNREEN